MSFDRVAKLYRPLETLAFGPDLARTRNALLSELTGARRVLILGEGDGRFLAQLLQVNAHCTVDCVDKSLEMVRLARKRVSKLRAETRVTFHHHDALTFAYPEGHYDLVVTLFFLDVFTSAPLEKLTGTLAKSLKPNGYWYLADFRVPQSPLKRLHSHLWLAVLYRFFTWQTDMEARALVEPAPYLLKNGLQPLRRQERRFGMLYSQLWQKGCCARSTTYQTSKRRIFCSSLRLNGPECGVLSV